MSFFDSNFRGKSAIKGAFICHFFDLETQNLNVRSITKNQKKKWEKNFLEPGAFSDKRFCKNLRACNFFPI